MAECLQEKSMIGDFKGLLRSLNAYKAFAAYNMVLIHAVSIMHPVLAPLGYGDRQVRGSMLRGFFSMTLPVIAGFYMRHLIGPYLENGRLRIDLSERMKTLVFSLLALEAIRLYTITFDLGWIFSWQVLHFIGLSVLVTYFCLKRGEKFLMGILLADIVLALILPPSIDQLASLEISPEILQWGSWIKSILFGALLARGAWMWKKNYFLSAMFLLAGMALMHFFGFRDPQNLTSFILLPAGIFSQVPGTRNFWPFLPFFPLFLFGYFLRFFLFDIKNQRWFLPLTAIVGIGGIIGLYLGFLSPDLKVLPTNAFSLEIFRRGLPGTMLFMSIFYFSWLGFYFLLKSHRFLWLDKWTQRAGNVLTLYLIHTLLYVLLKMFFLKIPELVNRYMGLGQMYLLLHVVYVLSVYLSYNFVRISNLRRKGI